MRLPIASSLSSLSLHPTIPPSLPPSLPPPARPVSQHLHLELRELGLISSRGCRCRGCGRLFLLLLLVSSSLLLLLASPLRASMGAVSNSPRVREIRSMHARRDTRRDKGPRGQTFLPPSFFASPPPLPSCWEGLAESFCGLSSFLPPSFLPPLGAGATPRVVSSLHPERACVCARTWVHRCGARRVTSESENTERERERERERASERARERAHSRVPQTRAGSGASPHTQRSCCRA